MKRAERHHLKQDEFVHWLDELVGWGQEHRRNVMNGLLAVGGAGLLLGGIYVYQSRQSEAAQAGLQQALESFHGFVTSDASGPAPSGVPSFSSETERYQAALAAFQDVAESYGGQEAGRQARYYQGVCHEALGENDAAVAAFEDVRGGSRDLLYYLASRSLASARMTAGDNSGASEVLRALVDDTDNPLPKDHLLFELARNEERAGNAAEARKYYDRMVAEYPTSSLRGDALNRSQALELVADSGAQTSD